MIFKYDPESQRVVSEENPDIFLSFHGIDRDLGDAKFIFNWGDVRIGLSNSDGKGGRIGNKVLSDGTLVFHLTELGREVRASRRPWGVLTNFDGFANEAEQQEILKLIADAFQVYDGDHQRMADGVATGEVIFSDTLKKRINKGEFIK